MMELFVDIAKDCIKPCFWAAVILCGSVGLLAVVSPRLLAAVNDRTKTWVDSSRLFALLDKPINADRVVMHYSRVFGGLALTVAVLAVYRYFTI